jgi:hypothetical protein
MFAGPAARHRQAADAFKQQRVDIPQDHVGHVIPPAVRRIPPAGIIDDAAGGFNKNRPAI